jgi:type II secretory pathway predicted ATPase ExeA
MPERSRGRFPCDPFAITPDPGVYVPREATETARKELLRSACNPAKTSALIGPPGLGKTLLLHLLAEEVPEETQTVYLPYAALPPAEICAWTLGLLGSPVAENPIAALQALSRDLHEQGSSLLLLIDDAGAMPIATARWAGEFVQNSGGSVRLAVAASDNATGNRVIAAIGSNFDIVHLNDPMTESETRKYIDGRLALARVPDSIRARFDDRIVRLLHRISAGIPRRLHSAAAEILQEAPVATADDDASAPTAPVAPPAEPVSSTQTLGVPSDERRASHRRAEPPDGVPVRVGLGGAPTDTGRRAVDRVEVPPEASEPAADEFVEPAADEFVDPAADEFVEPAADESRKPVSEDFTAPASARRAASPSRRAIALGSLLVAFVAVAIPVIRSILSEPHQIAAIGVPANPRRPVPADFQKPMEADLGKSMEADPRKPMQTDLGDSMRADLRKPMEAGSRKSVQADLRGSVGAIDSNLSVAGEAIGENRAATRAGEPRSVESPAGEPPSAATLGPLAVQINASPWANIEVDGIDLGATPLANIPLFAGAHSFRAKMPDGRVIERTVEIDAERRFISFE